MVVIPEVERSPTFVDVVSVHIDGVITFNASQPQFSRANLQHTTVSLQTKVFHCLIQACDDPCFLTVSIT